MAQPPAANPADPRTFSFSAIGPGPGQPTPAPGPLGAAPMPTNPANAPSTPGTALVPLPPMVQMNGVRATPLHVMMDEERRKADAVQAQPIIAPLAGHVRRCFQEALMAKRMTVEQRMLNSVRARRGEYDPVKLQAIRDMGGSEIFANLTSSKCRAAASWIRDVMMGQGDQRPWRIEPTPVAEVPPDVGEIIVNAVKTQIMQTILAGGDLSDAAVLEATLQARDAALAEVQQQAQAAADRMADLMEDQLLEGGFDKAMDAFIDDLTTFPAAILKGPVVRKKAVLKWAKRADGKGYDPVTSMELKLEWERVNPFKIFPSPSATTVDDGYLIEQHTLSRSDLNALIGVEGYDDASIRMVIEDYGRGGLRDWLSGLAEQTEAAGQSTVNLMQNPDGLIDALQFWGSVPGKWLVEWGMDPAEVPDETKEYHVEAWLVGNYVIKAVLNYDPLDRKPYYKASFEDVPGSWWGNSVADLVNDDQQVVNAAARGLINNMGIASGPQVQVNVSRLAPGEKITQITPWKIWQVTDDPLNPGGTTTPAISFFQPNSNVTELMAVFEKFSQLADEHSGIPRYLSGDTTGGAGRTASGLSMLIGNAGKSIKQVISSIDVGVMAPLLERLYAHNMLHAQDQALKGDVCVRACGADALLAKESIRQRRTEFLTATQNPFDMQIVGVLGRAAILREIAKDLGMDVNDVVPSPEILKAKFAAQQAMQAQAAPPAANPETNGQVLMDGTPVTDNHSPTPGAPGAEAAAR